MSTIIEHIELFPAMELEAQMIRHEKSGDYVVRVWDCTGGPVDVPIWCLKLVVEMLRKHGQWGV